MFGVGLFQSVVASAGLFDTFEFFEQLVRIHEVIKAPTTEAFLVNILILTPLHDLPLHLVEPIVTNVARICVVLFAIQLDVISLIFL